MGLFGGGLLMEGNNEVGGRVVDFGKDDKVEGVMGGRGLGYWERD
jgi:hypothetical protein